MMVALALALVASTSVGSPANPPAVARSNDDPPIQVWLSSNNRFVRGEAARVYIRAAKDGYVVVLRADAAGHVRVLFPLDPSNDELVRGDRKFEVEGDGGHEAFTVDEGDGTGAVLAAWSESPFTFDGLVQGDQWDEHALEAQRGEDREAALVEIVQGMAGENHFDYDVVNYTVGSVTAYNDDAQNDSSQDDGQSNNGTSNGGANYGGPYYGGPYYGPWFGPAYGGWGHPWRYGYTGGVFCDGFYWSAWGCGPYYDPFYSPFVFRTYGYRSYGYRPYRYRSYSTVRLGGIYGSIGRTGGSYGYRNRTSLSGGQPGLRILGGGTRVSATNRGFVRDRTGTRSIAPGSRSFAPRSGSLDRGSRSAAPRSRPTAAPRGDRSRGSAPATRSAPSDGSRRGGWSSPAPRSSGSGSDRGGGGGRGRRDGGGGGGGGGGGRSGGGGGGRRH